MKDLPPNETQKSLQEIRDSSDVIGRWTHSEAATMKASPERGLEGLIQGLRKRGGVESSPKDAEEEEEKRIEERERRRMEAMRRVKKRRKNGPPASRHGLSPRRHLSAALPSGSLARIYPPPPPPPPPRRKRLHEAGARIGKNGRSEEGDDQPGENIGGRWQLRIIVRRVCNISCGQALLTSPYVVISEAQQEIGRTSVRRNLASTTAVFNHRFVIDCDGWVPTFTLGLMDAKLLAKDVPLGQLRIDVSRLPVPGKAPGDVDVYGALYEDAPKTVNLYEVRERFAYFPRTVSGYFPIVEKQSGGHAAISAEAFVTLQLLTAQEARRNPVQEGAPVLGHPLNRMPTLKVPVSNTGNPIGFFLQEGVEKIRTAVAVRMYMKRLWIWLGALAVFLGRMVVYRLLTTNDLGRKVTIFAVLAALSLPAQYILRRWFFVKQVQRA